MVGGIQNNACWATHIQILPALWFLTTCYNVKWFMLRREKVFSVIAKKLCYMHLLSKINTLTPEPEIKLGKQTLFLFVFQNITFRLKTIKAEWCILCKASLSWQLIHFYYQTHQIKIKWAKEEINAKDLNCLDVICWHPINFTIPMEEYHRIIQAGKDL